MSNQYAVLAILVAVITIVMVVATLFLTRFETQMQETKKQLIDAIIDSGSEKPVGEKAELVKTSATDSGTQLRQRNTGK
jgi:hypothetical protein